MSFLLFYYQRPEPATWVFLSSFLLFGLYFAFHRVWSVRNLDLILLFLLAPGLMMVYEGRKARIETSISAAMQAPLAGTLIGNSRPNFGHFSDDRQSVERYTALQAVSGDVEVDEPRSEPVAAPSASDKILARSKSDWPPDKLEFRGFVSMLAACALLMIRMLIDPALVRRPLLEPNLSIGGLSFIGMSLFFFLMANVIVSNPREQHERGPRLGPGYALLNMLPELPTTPEHQIEQWSTESDEEGQAGVWPQNLARVLAIMANFAIVFGIVAVGYWHFENIKTGIGCATMYLLLPYTAQMTGDVEHALPAAMLTLAILSYRQPLLAGCFLGLAAGLVYYPLFLLPLWISFYWQRGLGRMLIGVIVMLATLAGLLLLDGLQFMIDHLRQMFGLWSPAMKDLQGIWGLGINPIFRLPVLVGFILLSTSFAFWPTRKNLGTLMCGTAAIMLAAQFWHGYGGGLYMSWFLPCVLLTIFRPNLDDRIGTKVVSPSWWNSGRLTVSNT